MKNLSNTEAEVKKTLHIKKHEYQLITNNHVSFHLCERKFSRPLGSLKIYEHDCSMIVVTNSKVKVLFFTFELLIRRLQIKSFNSCY